MPSVVDFYNQGVQEGGGSAYRPQVAAQPKSQQRKQGFIEKWNILPALGAILGGAGAGFLALPSGPGAIAAAMGGGAVGAGGGEALEQMLFRKKIESPGGIAAEAAMGGLGGPLGRILSIPARGATNILTGASRKLAATGLKIAPAAFTKAATAGVDLISTYLKYAPKIGPGLTRQLGTIGEYGTGTIDNLLKTAENTIQSSIKISGPTKRFTVDQLKSELIKHQNILSKIPGNEANIEALNDFIAKTATKYKGGLSAKQLLDIKRAADSKFGESVLKEEVGSVAAQAQKVLANAARSLLKGTYKNIDEALGQEQELILLKEMLGRTRGIVEAAGLPLGGLTAPLQQVLGAAGRTIPAVTGTLRREVPKAVIRGAEQATFRAPVSALQGLLGGGAQPQEQPNIEQMYEQIGGAGAVTPQMPTQEFNPYPLENFLSDIQRDPKNYSTYANLFQMLEKRAEKKVPTTTEEFITKAEVALDSLEGTKTVGYGPAKGRIYQFQSDVLGGQGLSPEVLKLDVKYKILKLAILRAYQGARISDKDFELANTYIPSLSTTNEKAKINLRLLRDLITNAVPPSGGQTSPQQSQQTDINQIQQLLGL